MMAPTPRPKPHSLQESERVLLRYLEDRGRNGGEIGDILQALSLVKEAYRRFYMEPNKET